MFLLGLQQTIKRPTAPSADVHVAGQEHPGNASYSKEDFKLI